jgi:hypothetical protein
VPSWMRANISGQCPRPAVRRLMFSIAPAVGMTVSVPCSRLARPASAYRVGFFFFATFVGASPASSFHASWSFGLLSIRSSSCSPRGFLCLVRGAFFLLSIGFQFRSQEDPRSGQKNRGRVTPSGFFSACAKSLEAFPRRHAAKFQVHQIQASRVMAHCRPASVPLDSE